MYLNGHIYMTIGKLLNGYVLYVINIILKKLMVN